MNRVLVSKLPMYPIPYILVPVKADHLLSPRPEWCYSTKRIFHCRSPSIPRNVMIPVCIVIPRQNYMTTIQCKQELRHLKSLITYSMHVYCKDWRWRGPGNEVMNTYPRNMFMICNVKRSDELVSCCQYIYSMVPVALVAIYSTRISK